MDLLTELTSPQEDEFPAGNNYVLKTSQHTSKMLVELTVTTDKPGDPHWHLDEVQIRVKG